MIDHALNTLEQLSNLSSQSFYYRQHQHLTIRLSAIKDTALSLGAQAGLAKESKIINIFLTRYQSQLDKIFDFKQILLKNNVLPPVITNTNNTVNIGQDAQSIRISGRTYKIVSQVKFVSTAPTWRDYLYMNYSNPDLPNKILLPQNSKEKQIWKDNIAKGWEQGINQAVSIYKINLNKLVRDYTGMVLYKELLTEGLVSPTYVDKKYNGITGNKNKARVDDWAWKIKNQPILQTNSKLWQPVVDDHYK